MILYIANLKVKDYFTAELGIDLRQGPSYHINTASVKKWSFPFGRKTQ